MSWLLFMDESGHDHKTMPYEVRGGIALHAAKLWPFIQSWHRLELETFGTELKHFQKEIKGCKLLDKKRIKWAEQSALLPDDERRTRCLNFSKKGHDKKPPSRDEFTAYGQACIKMVAGIFELLAAHNARLFAAAIPKAVPRPVTTKTDDFLRKDHVFLFERYFNFLEENKENGLIIMDETERSEDSRFVNRLHCYFQNTKTGKSRSARIVPVPFFVASDMAIPVQAADLCIYCINWGFRLPQKGMLAAERLDVKKLTAKWIRKLQYHGTSYRDGEVYNIDGIVFVPAPYGSKQ